MRPCKKASWDRFSRLDWRKGDKLIWDELSGLPGKGQEGRRVAGSGDGEKIPVVGGPFSEVRSVGNAADQKVGGSKSQC